MPRSRTLIGLLAAVALGVTIAVVKVTDKTATRKTSGPAIHAVVIGAAGPVDVWRDSRGRLTFHHVVDQKGELDRWNPKTHTMDSLTDGSLDDSESGLTDAQAWTDINAWYAVDKTTVMDALASGERSPEPFGFKIAAPKVSRCGFPQFKDYGTEIDKMAAATKLVLPRLATLHGERLSALSGATGCVGAMTYGSSSDSIQVDVGADHRGDVDSPVQVYKSSFASMPHHHGPVEYAAQQSEIYFRYRPGEWIWINSSFNFTPKQAKDIVRAVVSAPTVG